MARGARRLDRTERVSPADILMRILLVEDDSRIAKFVAKGLRERSYAVDVAINGDGALDLEVDPDGQTATRAGQRLRLTTKQYALLEYLALTVGQVIGREEIAEHVWDETFDRFSNPLLPRT